MGSNEPHHGVTRVIARALHAAFPTPDSTASPDAQRAFAALDMIDDMLALLPAAEDLSAFMAQVYAINRKTEGDTLRITHLADTYRRIEQAMSGARSHYVTADYARLTQADAVIREAFAMLHDRSYVRAQRGDEIGFQVIAAMLIGEYPSGRKFEIAVTWDVPSQQWRLEGGAYADADAPGLLTIDEVIGQRLDASVVARVNDATCRLIRACSKAPIQLHTTTRVIR